MVVTPNLECFILGPKLLKTDDDPCMFPALMIPVCPRLLNMITDFVLLRF